MLASPLVDYSVGDWPRLRAEIEQSGIALFQAEFEMALAVFLGAILEGNTAHKDQMLAALGQKLGWTDWRAQLFKERIDALPSYSVEHFEAAPKLKALGAVVTRLALSASRLDGKWSYNERAFTQNLADRSGLDSQAVDAWKQSIENQISGQPAGDLDSELEALMNSAQSRKSSDDRDVASDISLKPSKKEASAPKEDLDACLKELDELVGLENVKEEIRKLSDFLKVQRMREDAGLATAAISNHMVFTGNPGTGKTTVARLVARIFKALGFLKKGHLIEVDRSGLVGQYVGHTETKTREVINSALDGILFIDEAYALVGEGKEDFGRQAVDALVKMMEDHRKRLVVIVAGYSGPMDRFINANPGLQSRFTTYIDFPNYEVDALVEIFEIICSKNQYKLADDAGPALRACIEKALEQEPESFGNGRYCRNLFEQTLRIHAMRLARMEKPPSKEDLSLLQAADFVVGD
ncbi:MAG: AAA family ATPase [Opitutales bacterium]